MVILDKILQIENYIYIDLIEVNQLIDKFVGNFDVNFSYTFTSLQDKFKFDSELDLVISNYAFSELPRNLQNLALDKVINNSKNGYMIINSVGLENNIFLKKYDFHTVNE